MNRTMLTFHFDFINHHVGTLEHVMANSNKTIALLREVKDSTQSKGKHISKAMDIIKETEKLNEDLNKEHEYFASKLKGISHD